MPYKFIPARQGKQRNPKRKIFSIEIKKDEDAVPPEVIERYGDISICKINGYLYGHHRKKWVAISRLVWLYYHPRAVFNKNDRIMYINKNILDNRIDNLERK